MAAQTSTPVSSMTKFVLDEYLTFSKAVFNLANTISLVKWLKRDFVHCADCVQQAKALIHEKSMKETDELISQGCLQGYNI